MTTATDVAPGTKWYSKRSVHSGREVEVERITGGDQVICRVVPKTGNNAHAGEAKIYTIARDKFLSMYGPNPSNGRMALAPAVQPRFRRVAPATPATKLPAAPKPFKPVEGLVKTGKTKLNIEVIDISPDLAKQWLERSKNMINRPVHQQWVQTLMQAIRRGEWHLTGDSIKMTAAGEVVDGQHRLLAIAQSGVVCQSVVVRGVHPTAFAVMDTGKGRSVGDILHLYGITDRYAKAGMVRILLLLEATGRPVTSTMESRGIVSPQATLAYLEHHPEVDIATRLADSVRQLLEGGKGVWGAAFVLMLRQDKVAAERFAYLLRTGEDLSKGNPILLLQRRLRNQHNPYFSKDRGAREELMAIILKSWNAWRAGETLEQLKWSGHSRKPEPFPVAI